MSSDRPLYESMGPFQLILLTAACAVLIFGTAYFFQMKFEKVHSTESSKSEVLCALIFKGQILPTARIGATNARREGEMIVYDEGAYKMGDHEMCEIHPAGGAK